MLCVGSAIRDYKVWADVCCEFANIGVSTDFFAVHMHHLFFSLALTGSLEGDWGKGVPPFAFLAL